MTKNIVTTSTPQFHRWLMTAKSVVDIPEGNVNERHLTYMDGRRYIKIIVEGPGQMWVYAFIDKTNGNVLKPETWSRPAKGPRGNIFQDGYEKWLTPYGMQYYR